MVCASPRRHRGSALLSLAVRPRVAQVCPFPADFGADGCAGAKALLEADDGDAYGRRLLLGGVVMALPMLSRLERQGKPQIWLAGSDSGGTTVSCPPWRRCLGCSRFPRSGKMESRLTAAVSMGSLGAMYIVGGASLATSPPR